MERSSKERYTKEIRERVNTDTRGVLMKTKKALSSDDLLRSNGR
jgi:hypothetical protein